MIGPKVEKVDNCLEMIDFISKGSNIKKPVLAPIFINSVRPDIIFKSLPFVKKHKYKIPRIQSINNIKINLKNLIKVAEMNYTHSQQVQKIISKNKKD